MLDVSYYGDAGPGPKGTMLVASFLLNGENFMVLNGGPRFKFNHAVSFVVNTETQEETDYYWEKLSEGGETEMCGWLRDKFGLSWQIVPVGITRLLSGKDPAKVNRAMASLMKMSKLNLSELEAAYEGA